MRLKGSGEEGPGGDKAKEPSVWEQSLPKGHTALDDGLILGKQPKLLVLSEGRGATESGVGSIRRATGGMIWSPAKEVLTQKPS